MLTTFQFSIEKITEAIRPRAEFFQAGNANQVDLANSREYSCAT